MLNIQKQSGGKSNLSIEKHEFSIIFQWLQSLQIYPLCGCKDTTYFPFRNKIISTPLFTSSPHSFQPSFLPSSPLQLSLTSIHSATLVLPIVFVVKRKKNLQRRKHTLPSLYFMPQCKPQVVPLKGSHLSASGSEPTANLQRTFTGPSLDLRLSL